MSNPPQPVTIKILDKEYRVSCTEDERSGLVASAEYLSQRMQEIRAAGKVVGVDRIAVMAALNITHELLQKKTRKPDYFKALGGRIVALQEKIEVALNKGRQLEI